MRIAPGPLLLCSSINEESKAERISDAKAGVLIVEQVKPAVLKGTAVRFSLSKNEGVK
jgi:hypothetical protein